MGVKDTWYCGLLAKEDLPRFYKLAEKVRMTHSQQLVDDFNSSLERGYNDHKSEFIDITKSDDLPLTAGLRQCCDLITGANAFTFQYMKIGISSTAPIASQTALISPVSFDCDMSLFGWREWASTSLRFLGIFAESCPTNTISESGVFNPTGIYLNRGVFYQPISHTVNITGFVISSIVEFVPVM